MSRQRDLGFATGVFVAFLVAGAMWGLGWEMGRRRRPPTLAPIPIPIQTAAKKACIPVIELEGEAVPGHQQKWRWQIQWAELERLVRESCARGDP